MNSFFRYLGVSIQIFVLGELLFLTLIAMYSLQVGAKVFKYAQF